MKVQSTTGLIILAAGASERMGKPKQMLEHNGKSLLGHIVEAALESVCRPIVVVVGANAEVVIKEAANFPVRIAENPHWKSGMSGSIKVGLEKLLEINEPVNGVVITVCDQPFVSAELINRLVETFQTGGALIVACRYAATLGVPAVFDRELFPQLFDLETSGGAKSIIERYAKQTIAVSFPKGAIDIDTPTDYAKLDQSRNRL